MAKLINEETGTEIQTGDKVVCFRGEEYILQRACKWRRNVTGVLPKCSGC